jgi:uncharacterized protein
LRISVNVQPKSSMEKIVKCPDGGLKVYIRQSPEKGKANTALLKVIARYLGVKTSSLRIVKGQTSRKKVIEIGL